MDIKIRNIAENDYSNLLSLFKEFSIFEKQSEKMVNTLELMNAQKDNIKGFVAVNNENEIVGYVTYFFAYFTWIGKSLYMDDLYVRPAFRGCGVGTKLIKNVISYAKNEHCAKLRWQVSEWNHPAIDFYKKLGASVDETESNCDLIF